MIQNSEAKITGRIPERKTAANLLRKNLRRLQCNVRVSRNQKLLQKVISIRPAGRNQAQKTQKKAPRQDQPPKAAAFPLFSLFTFIYNMIIHMHHLLHQTIPPKSEKDPGGT